MAERIIPCADLSQHITLPGSEASGTSHMKFMLNGALILASLDGANNEILTEVGDDNIFIFGMDFDAVEAFRTKDYNPMKCYCENTELKHCLDQIVNGYYSPTNVHEFKPLVDRLLIEDKYLVLADYANYVRTQELIAEAFLVR